MDITRRASGSAERCKLWESLASEREKWAFSPRPSVIEPCAEGEESVWDFPRPPIVRSRPGEYRVELNGEVMARSHTVLEVCETAGAPVPYFPPDDVRRDRLIMSGAVAVCEWKGEALVFDIAPDLPSKTGETGPAAIPGAAWCYPEPFDFLPEGYASIAGWFCFHPGHLDCFIGEEKARAQPGGYYAGWIHDRLRGPIKGASATLAW